MRLSSLNVTSNIRIVQPNVGDASQTSDFEFELTRNADIPDNFYELVFYKMLNGYLSGIDGGGVNCGFKFVCYDNNDNTLFETTLTRLDKYLTESKKVFEITNEYDLPDATVDVWLKTVDVHFIANNNNVAETYTVLTSSAPQKCSFSEQIDSNAPDQAVKIIGGQDSKIMFDFKMEL